MLMELHSNILQSLINDTMLNFNKNLGFTIPLWELHHFDFWLIFEN